MGVFLALLEARLPQLGAGLVLGLPLRLLRRGDLLLDLEDRAAARGGPAAPLRDELSDAELRVVRYLPSNLTASEIASELVVSANTVRTHMRHIYAKLDAHSRSEAVARARELGLVAPR